MTVAISIGIFLSIILFVEGMYYCYHQYLNPQNRNLKRRLRGGSGKPQDLQKANETAGILRQRKMSDLPWLQDLLVSMKNLGGLEKLLQQANSQMPVGVFFLLSGVLGGGGLVIATLKDYGLFPAIGLGLLGSGSSLALHQKKEKAAL